MLKNHLLNVEQIANTEKLTIDSGISFDQLIETAGKGVFNEIRKEGFLRVRVNGEVMSLDDKFKDPWNWTGFGGG